MKIDKKQKNRINAVLQVVILLFITIFFYQKLGNEELINGWYFLLGSMDDHFFLWLVILLLMPVNWLLESFKWKRLCKPLFNISFLKSIKGVLTGLAVSFVTPHGWGDYVGRIAILKEDERERLVGALMFGRMAQLFVTVVTGITGLVMYLEVWPYLYFWYIASFIAIAFLLVFNRTIFNYLKPRLHKISKFFSIIKRYNTAAVLEVLMISAVRYIVFALQFFIILKVLNVELPALVLFGGITWIFLIKSIIPSFNFLSDLGIREVSAIMFFETYLTDVSPVVSATFIIWIINILLPTIAGSLFVFSIKAVR